MPIPESQLKTWSHQGAVATAKQTHESIRTALSQYKFPEGVNYEVYLQGSYKNDTNIRGDSDVDVVVQLNSSFCSNLTEEQKHKFGFKSATYGWHHFRKDVLAALMTYYDNSKVREGRKALKVETPYLPADVVVCIQYRNYRQPPRSESDFVEGITFYVPSEGRWVINYPKLHYDNGVNKHQATDSLYKPTVRMFKNARTYMIDRGAPSDLAPSYFLECLIYNVPNSQFSGTFKDVFCNVVNWLWSASLDDFVCQNEQMRLFGDTPEQWSIEKAKRFLKALLDLWNNWR